MRHSHHSQQYTQHRTAQPKQFQSLGDWHRIWGYMRVVKWFKRMDVSDLLLSHNNFTYTRTHTHTSHFVDIDTHACTCAADADAKLWCWYCCCCRRCCCCWCCYCNRGCFCCCRSCDCSCTIIFQRNFWFFIMIGGMSVISWTALS